jgi:peptidylprolyl isomerase
MMITESLKLVVALLFTVGAVVLSAAELRSPYQIVEQAAAAEWRAVAPENSLYIELANGTVVVELLAEIAPHQSANFKALVREGYYDGQTIYRVIDGFVAQGGGGGDGPEPMKAERQLPGEFDFQGELPYSFTRVDIDDGFAAESGFMHGFALGRAGDIQWLLHCPGAFALARDNDPASGGTEFYAVLGHAPRYLDRNDTVFGMVRHGMEHLQALIRGTEASGLLEPARRNPITRVRVGADLPVDERLKLQVMRTDSASFEELVRSRANRPEPWFVFTPGYVDVCGVRVPVRLQ